MSETKAPAWEINTPTSSVSLNILIAALKNVKFRNTKGGMADIVSLTIFIYASILLSKLDNYAKVDPSANSDSQTETMSNATQWEGSKTDRQGLLNIKEQWNPTLHICWQAAAVKKDEFLARREEPRESWSRSGKEGPGKICFLST